LTSLAPRRDVKGYAAMTTLTSRGSSANKAFEIVIPRLYVIVEFVAPLGERHQLRAGAPIEYEEGNKWRRVTKRRANHLQTGRSGLDRLRQTCQGQSFGSKL
jgi:hypothetical protein